jgi:hypothetical protein
MIAGQRVLRSAAGRPLLTDPSIAFTSRKGPAYIICKYDGRNSDVLLRQVERNQRLDRKVSIADSTLVC